MRLKRKHMIRLKTIVQAGFGLFGLRLQRAVNPEIRRWRMITFAKKSDYSLVIIGAHDGSKLGHIVHKAAAHGKVLLVEPTPYLFKRLKAKYSQNPQVELFNAAITHAKNVKIDFFMVEDEASGLRRYGNQLGSLDPNHAAKSPRRLW